MLINLSVSTLVDMGPSGYGSCWVGWAEIGRKVSEITLFDQQGARICFSFISVRNERMNQETLDIATISQQDRFLQSRHPANVITELENILWNARTIYEAV